MNLDTLLAELRARVDEGRAHEPITLNLNGELRRAKVTIRELAAELGVTLKRVREVRGLRAVPFLVAVDHLDAIRRVQRRQQTGVTL